MSSTHQAIALKLCHQARKFAYRVELLQMPNGVVGEYAYIRHPGAAIVVPVTADGKFMLVKQYRFPVQKYVLEFPAGTLEAQEDPADAIKRELAEETGHSAQNWQYLGAFYICPGYSDEILHAYLARNLQQIPHPPAQDADEDITVEVLSMEELQELILAPKGLIGVDAKTVTCFYMALAQL